MKQPRTLPTPWHLGNRRVRIAARAELPSALRPQGDAASLIQAVLNAGLEWPQDSKPIWQLNCFENFEVPTTTIPMTPGMDIVWGICENHQARRPLPSPFAVLPEDEQPKTSILTVELVGRRHSPLLVRAYFGPRVPPLPWMLSAHTSPEKLQGCRKFWSENAYLRSPLNEIRGGSIEKAPPQWWLNCL